MHDRRLFDGMLRAASKAQKPFAKGGMIRHLPLFLSGMTQDRSLPAIAEQPLRDRFERLPARAGAQDRAALHAGCLIDFAYPAIGEAVVRALSAAEIEVVFPRGQTCCGVPARYAGAFDVAFRPRANAPELLVRFARREAT